MFTFIAIDGCRDAAAAMPLFDFHVTMPPFSRRLLCQITSAPLYRCLFHTLLRHAAVMIMLDVLFFFISSRRHCRAPPPYADTPLLRLMPP